MKTVLALTLSVVAGSAAPVAAAQSSRAADAAWLRVGELSPGSEIIVMTNGTQSVPRCFVAATAADLTVSDCAGWIEAIPRGRISEIRIPSPYSPRKDALHGLIVGAAAYGAAGTVLCRAFGTNGSCAGSVLRVSAFGGGFTAGISIAAGAIKHRIKPTQVIYRSP